MKPAKDVIAKARQIQSEVASEWGMTRETMLYRGKSRGKVAARAEAMRRCRTTLAMSYPEIGQMFNVHHATVMHHIGPESKAKEERALIPSLEACIRKQARIIATQAGHIAQLAQSLEKIGGNICAS